jgi:hypothetical protein
MNFFDIFYLTFIALRDSAFVKISFLVILYVLKYLSTMPTKDWYSYNTNGDYMPRYNLNHQDVDTIVSGLNNISLQASSTKEHTRITNLKNRLLSKLSSESTEEDPNQDIDPWDSFMGDK